MRHPRALIAIAALALMTAACGGSGESADTADAPEPSAAASTTPAPATTAASTTTTAAITTTAPQGETDETGGTSGLEINIITQGDSFSTKEIRVPAGEEVTIIVDDRDTGTDEPHNFHVRAGDQNFFTDIKPAPNTQTLTFTIDTAGVYEFFCDTHALTMNGEFIVEDDM